MSDYRINKSIDIINIYSSKINLIDNETKFTLYENTNNTLDYDYSQMNSTELSYPLYMQIIYSCFYIATLPLGVIGNAIVPIVVYKDRELCHSSTGAFIVNLAVADLLVLIVCLPLSILELFNIPNIWVYPQSMCKY